MIIVKVGDVTEKQLEDAHYLKDGKLKKVVKGTIYWDRVVITLDGYENLLTVSNDDYFHISK